MKHRDRGSILLFTLFSLLVVSFLVYKTLRPYRQTVGDVQSIITRDRGISYLYSMENIVQTLLPRVDINIYRQINNINPGEPIVLTFPVPEGTLQASLFSNNTCFNITLPPKPMPQTVQKLESQLKMLAQLTSQNKINDESIIQMLNPDSQGDSLIDDKVPAWQMKNNSATTAAAFEQLHPWICRRFQSGQYIDVNAIDMQTLPVLETLLPVTARGDRIMQIYAKRKNAYWHSVDEFIQQLPKATVIPNSVRNMLGVSSQDFYLTFSYQTQNASFSAVSWLHMNNGQLSVVKRRLIADNSL
jgi:hypothetical protein